MYLFISLVTDNCFVSVISIKKEYHDYINIFNRLLKTVRVGNLLQVLN